MIKSFNEMTIGGFIFTILFLYFVYWIFLDGYRDNDDYYKPYKYAKTNVDLQYNILRGN